MVESDLLEDVEFVSEDSEMLALGLWLHRLTVSAASFGRDNRGPFMLTHIDLHMNNTLVDDVSGSAIC